MGGAGCAMLDDIGSSLVNPALLNAWNRTIENSHWSVWAGFGNDSLFSAVTPVGASRYIPGVGTFGLMGRYDRNSPSTFEQEGALVFSTRLFEHTVSKGGIDCGITLKGQNMSWTLNTFPALHSLRYLSGPDSSYILAVDSAEGSKIRERGVAMDIGLYQSSLAERVDFGVTCYNVFGRTWRWSRPSLKKHREYIIHTDTIDYPFSEEKDTTGYIDSRWYENYFSKNDFWTDSRYRSVKIGVALKTYLREYDVEVILPADIELLDITGVKHAMLRAGVEAQIYGNFYLRAGFAREPRRYTAVTAGTFENENRFSFGAGASFFPVSFSMCFGRGGMGFDSCVRF
jgi:hypothetical protein